MQKKNKMGHFVGSIVNIAEQAMPTGVQKYMIIDGQQRITTLTLLLIALRDYAESHPEGQGINAKRIDNIHAPNIPQLELINGCGHNVQYNLPEEFAKVLKKQLERR